MARLTPSAVEPATRNVEAAGLVRRRQRRTGLAAAILAVGGAVGAAAFGWTLTHSEGRPAVTNLFGGRWDGWWASQAEIRVGQPFLFAQDLDISNRSLWRDRVTVDGMRFAGTPPRYVRHVGEIDIPGMSVWSATSAALRREVGNGPLERAIHPSRYPPQAKGWRWYRLRGYSEAGLAYLGDAAMLLTASRPGLYLFREPTVWGVIRLKSGRIERWRETFEMHYVACVGFGYNRCVSMIDRLYQKNGV